MDVEHELLFTPTDFVAVVNQIFQTAVPRVTIEGEVSNFRVSRGKWVYFDLKDESASLKCFMTVYQLAMPIDDGMMVRVAAAPQLHPLYNFSLTVEHIVPVGEGSIKKSTDLLAAKLQAEGLFDESRKRSLPFAPEKVGLITSKEAAAFGDFMKVSLGRWGLTEIQHHEVHVQGEKAASEIVAAIERCNAAANPVEVIVITRGGGSADDLLAFQDEQLVRAIAASRIPTLVAIGHERDFTLSELAADVRASTPSNAAELLFPDRTNELSYVRATHDSLGQQLRRLIDAATYTLSEQRTVLLHRIEQIISSEQRYIELRRSLLTARDPQAVLAKGYALLRKSNHVIRSVDEVVVDDHIELTLQDGTIAAQVEAISYNKRKS